MLIGGRAVMGLPSGLVRLAGLIGAAIFPSLDLSLLAYVASAATTAVATHLVKWAVYQRVVVPDGAFWFLAAGMSAAMVAGTWVGKRLIETLPVARFRLLVAGLLAVTAFR